MSDFLLFARGLVNVAAEVLTQVGVKSGSSIWTFCATEALWHVEVETAKRAAHRQHRGLRGRSYLYCNRSYKVRTCLLSSGRCWRTNTEPA